MTTTPTVTVDELRDLDADDAHFAKYMQECGRTGGMRTVADEHEQDRHGAQAVETVDARVRICETGRRRRSVRRDDMRSIHARTDR